MQKAFGLLLFFAILFVRSIPVKALLAYYPMCEPMLERDPRIRKLLLFLKQPNDCGGKPRGRVAAEQTGAVFVDCKEAISDQEGNLCERYKVEGIHLCGNGCFQI